MEKLMHWPKISRLNYYAIYTVCHVSAFFGVHVSLFHQHKIILLRSAINIGRSWYYDHRSICLTASLISNHRVWFHSFTSITDLPWYGLNISFPRSDCRLIPLNKYVLYLYIFGSTLMCLLNLRYIKDESSIYGV